MVLPQACLALLMMPTVIKNIYSIKLNNEPLKWETSQRSFKFSPASPLLHDLHDFRFYKYKNNCLIEK